MYYLIRNFNHLGFLAWAKGSLIRIGHLMPSEPFLCTQLGDFAK